MAQSLEPSVTWDLIVCTAYKLCQKLCRIPYIFFRLKACTGLDPKNDGRPQASFDRMQSFFVGIWKIIPTVLWEFEVFSLGEFSHFPHEENRSVAGEALSSGLGLHGGSARSVVRVPWGGFFMVNSQLCRATAWLTDFWMLWKADLDAILCFAIGGSEAAMSLTLKASLKWKI